MEEQPVAFAIDRAVTKELGDQFHIRRLTAAGACAAELKQRAQQLRILDRGRIESTFGPYLGSS